jgi:serine/threonine-protein kinase PRP4
LLEGRYQIYGNVGRGVFSTVLRAKDLTTQQDVAIKVIRNNDVMYKAGQKELTLLKTLASRDSEDKKHCIRLLAHFEFKNHLCLVFEPMAYPQIILEVGREGGSVREEA